ncbi:MAG: hypothetical protein ACKOQ1_07545, partial [Actinomycetota bacterium]
MRGRDANGREPGPLPAHERAWRHPAEVGAKKNLPRREIPATPPLRRRTTAVVAATSVCASMLLLAVALPSRIDPPANNAGTETADDRPVADQAPVDSPPGPSVGVESATGTRVKNSGLGVDVAVDGTSIAVVAVGEGLLATSADALGADTTARFTINGTLVAATVIGIDGDHRILGHDRLCDRGRIRGDGCTRHSTRRSSEPDRGHMDALSHRDRGCTGARRRSGVMFGPAGQSRAEQS